MSASDDQEGYVSALNLTVSLCLTYTLCIAGVRVRIRKGVFGVDDLVVLFATIATLGHTGSSYAALADGLGKPWAHLESETDLKSLNAVSTKAILEVTSAHWCVGICCRCGHFLTGPVCKQDWCPGLP